MTKPQDIQATIRKAKAAKLTDQEPEKMQSVKQTTQDRNTPPSRVGKKPAIAYIDPAGMRELKMLSIETGRSQQDLLVEAINDFLIDKGKKGLA